MKKATYDKSKKKGYRYVVDNKLKAFGITHYDKKTIKVNKKLHKKARKLKKGHIKKYGIPKKDMTLINTIVHEELHRKHPKMTEKSVRKKARTDVKKLSKKQRSRLYAKFK